MVKLFARGAADSGLIASRVKPMTIKLVFTAFQSVTWPSGTARR